MFKTTLGDPIDFKWKDINGNATSTGQYLPNYPINSAIISNDGFTPVKLFTGPSASTLPTVTSFKVDAVDGFSTVPSQIPPKTAFRVSWTSTGADYCTGSSNDRNLELTNSFDPNYTSGEETKSDSGFSSGSSFSANGYIDLMANKTSPTITIQCFKDGKQSESKDLMINLQASIKSNSWVASVLESVVNFFRK